MAQKYVFKLQADQYGSMPGKTCQFDRKIRLGKMFDTRTFAHNLKNYQPAQSGNKKYSNQYGTKRSAE
jgi:hypothetical protein